MAELKIVCISDTHGKHAALRLPEGDVLIHAGDFMTYGDRLSEIASFNHWLSKQPHRHKIVIAGNHDLLFESDPSLARTQLTAATYLENSAVEIEGLRLWGSPQQPRFLDWAFNVDRGPAIRRYWNMIPAGTDILITHGPPFGILDTITSSDEHLGCEELAVAVQRVRPKLHMFGHIHSGHGESEQDGIRYVNASILDENYRIAYSPQVVTLD
jgi:Icc-related predicted phosphoesterase